MRLHFVHGWGFGPSVWAKLAEMFAGATMTFADRGYFAGRGDPWPDERAVCIAHSFGTMLGLQANPRPWRAMVAVNGFDRFTSSDDAVGVAPRVLERMLARFDCDPVAAVSAFRLRCGSREPFGPICADRLKRDLEALRDMDCRAQAARLAVPVLSLQGAGDPILPADMRARTLSGNSRARRAEHPAAGHLLPVEQPEWCAAQISAFVRDVW